MPKGRVASLGGLGKNNKAPLVETDINELGDKRLNPEEAVIREREALLKMTSQFKIAGQDELENPDRSSGARMGYRELIRRLAKLNPSLRFLDSQVRGVPTIAVYRPKTETEQRADGSYFDLCTKPSEELRKNWKYVAGFDRAELPQFSHILTDTSNLPTAEVRSWRSVLIMLIKAGVITYGQAIQEFGDPSGDQRSGRWFEELREYIFGRTGDNENGGTSAQRAAS